MKVQNFASLTSFVEAQTAGQSKDFAREYRHHALEAVDFVSATLRRNPTDKHTASDTLDDLRNSLHAIKDMTLLGRQDNIDSARQMISDSTQSGVLDTGTRKRPLEAPTSQSYPSMVNVTVAGQVNTALPPDYQKKIVGSAVNYGQETAALDSAEPSCATTVAAWQSGTKTLALADKTAPLVQTVLAHPSFGREEAVIVDEQSAGSSTETTSTASRGLFHHQTNGVVTQQNSAEASKVVTPVPMLEEALQQLQALRDLISQMRPMPATVVGIQVGRPVTEQVTLQAKEWPWSTPTESQGLVKWNTWNNPQTSLWEPRDVLNVPCVPDYVALP